MSWQSSYRRRQIASYRRNTGLTQELLAEKLRVTPETVSRFERGVIGTSYESLELLAAEFWIGLRNLFDFDTGLPLHPVRTPVEQAATTLMREPLGRSPEGKWEVHRIVRHVLGYRKWRAKQRRGKAG